MLSLGPLPEGESDLPDLQDRGTHVLGACALLDRLGHPDVFQVFQPAEELPSASAARELLGPVYPVVEGIAFASVHGAHGDLGEVCQGRGRFGRRSSKEKAEEAGEKVGEQHGWSVARARLLGSHGFTCEDDI